MAPQCLVESRQVVQDVVVRQPAHSVRGDLDSALKLEGVHSETIRALGSRELLHVVQLALTAKPGGLEDLPTSLGIQPVLLGNTGHAHTPQIIQEVLPSSLVGSPKVLVEDVLPLT